MDVRSVRLLYVIPYYLPAIDFGGPVSVCAALAQEMSSRGHAVTVLTTDVGSRHSRVPVRHEKLAGTDVVRLRNISQTLVKTNLFTPIQTCRTLAGLLPRADLVHVHEFFAWPCFRAATEANLSGLPVLLSGHGSISLSPERGRERFKRIWHTLFGARTLTASTLLQAATTHEAAQCELLGVPRSKIRMIPHGVKPAEIGSGANFRARYETGERPILLFVGRLLRSKGIDLLLAAARSLASHPSHPLFVLVGPAENRSDLATPGYLKENVLLTGALSGPELADAYRAADLFTLPSFAEGMPVTALEALSFGVPTLLSRACNLPEVEAAGAGIQVDAEVSSVRAGIERMLARRETLSAMASAALELARDRFNLRRVHDEYERLYMELAHA